MNLEALDRLFEYSTPTAGDSPCWIWQRAVNASGYGVSRFPGFNGPQMVHRVAWSILNGPIPDGHEIDHTCSVRTCCAPLHLQLVLPDQHKRITVERRAANRPPAVDTRPPSGSIRARVGKKRTTFTVLWREYRHEGMKQCSKPFYDEAEAQAFLATLPNRPYLAKRQAV